MFGVRKKAQDISNIDVFLCDGICIEGVLSFESSAVIEGNFRGNIVKGEYLTVGRRSEVTGNISVDYLVVSGCVRGNIKAEKGVEIKASARVYGDIETPEFTLVKGAVFAGTRKSKNNFYATKKGDLLNI